MDDLISRAAAIEAMTADNLSWNLDSVNDDDLKKAARAAQRALARLPAAQRWVPVTERPPKERVPVLAICKNGVMFVAEYEWTNYDGAHWNTRGPLGSGRRIGKARVTHWMPLPELPKEEP